MAFSEVLKRRREQARLSLRSLAKAVSVDAAYLSRVESGTVPPSDSLLKALARALEVTEEELFLLAGRVPDSLRHLVEERPGEVAAALGGLAAMVVGEPTAPYGGPILAGRGRRAIEDGFPFVELSDTAEIESWRKEVYRPVYHLHKWWAQRLGSVFRAVLLGASMPRGSAVMDLFYQPVRLPAPVVFDPFMGSGTTIGEAHKLGCTVVGRDINPVACRNVRVALSPLSRRKLERLFDELETAARAPLQRLYQGRDRAGQPCDVLYYFWVKVLPCPACRTVVDLFSSHVFARHAYPTRHPEVQVLCPDCGDVFTALHTDSRVRCGGCARSFDPREGAVSGASARCPACDATFPLARTARRAGRPPEHRLYAKLVLRADGSREYVRATADDLRSYRRASRALRALAPPLPVVPIRDGFNTRQALSWGYTTWDQMFNDRQHLALALLASGIRELEPCPERDALLLLFSGTLEFNNMFASYKGEGTGAVRHMFSHHVLKPERTPIEANVWGTPKSSGSFSTLFRSRLLRALDYKQAPFEVAAEERGGVRRGRKVFGVSPPMGAFLLDRFPEDGLPAGAVYLSCGDSAHTDLPDRSVDLVVTDPPFFDNVHYSELADFFHVWQRLYFEDEATASDSTRREEEVQDTDVEAFAEKLCNVFRECRRALRDDGLLVFSYHHSREDGWLAVASAVWGAGFSFVAAQPVKAEMSVATPKRQASSPIDLDVLLVCRKRSTASSPQIPLNDAREEARSRAAEQIRRFNAAGRALSENDVRVVLHSQILVALSACAERERAREALTEELARAPAWIERAWRHQDVSEPKRPNVPAQLSLSL